MSIIKELYGKTNGNEVYAYTIDNENGLTAQVHFTSIVLRVLIFS